MPALKMFRLAETKTIAPPRSPYGIQLGPHNTVADIPRAWAERAHRIIDSRGRRLKERDGPTHADD